MAVLSEPYLPIRSTLTEQEAKDCQNSLLPKFLRMREASTPILPENTRQENCESA